MAKMDTEQVRCIEALVRRIAEIPDEESRQAAHALMEAILQLHGAGLERMMEIVFESADGGKTAMRRFASDELVSSLLVLHGLHPDDVGARAQHALNKMRLNAEITSVFEGVIHIRLSGNARGSRAAVEAAIREAAPDAVDVVIEESSSPGDFVPLTSLGVAVPGTV